MFSTLCCRSTTNYVNKLYPFYKLLTNNAIHKNFVYSKYTFKVKNIRYYYKQKFSQTCYFQILILFIFCIHLQEIQSKCKVRFIICKYKYTK